jgi:hypothetical protein
MNSSVILGVENWRLPDWQSAKITFAWERRTLVLITIRRFWPFCCCILLFMLPNTFGLFGVQIFYLWVFYLTKVVLEMLRALNVIDLWFYSINKREYRRGNKKIESWETYKIGSVNNNLINLVRAEINTMCLAKYQSNCKCVVLSTNISKKSKISKLLIPKL